MATAVVSFQWFFWGYSLAFSHKAGKYMGALDNFGLMGVLGAPSVGSPRIPDLMFAVYQGMFAAITYVLTSAMRYIKLISHQCCACCRSCGRAR
jgi:Amt family ammonium transporter